MFEYVHDCCDCPAVHRQASHGHLQTRISLLCMITPLICSHRHGNIMNTYLVYLWDGCRVMLAHEPRINIHTWAIHTHSRMNHCNAHSRMNHCNAHSRMNDTHFGDVHGVDVIYCARWCSDDAITMLQRCIYLNIIMFHTPRQTANLNKFLPNLTNLFESFYQP